MYLRRVDGVRVETAEVAELLGVAALPLARHPLWVAILAAGIGLQLHVVVTRAEVVAAAPEWAGLDAADLAREAREEWGHRVVVEG